MEFRRIDIQGYEKVVIATDKESGLKAIISVHNTSLGPAVGGTRLYPYNSEQEALEDVLRLSKGMTYKSSLAGVDFGGGKSVIIANPQQKNTKLLKAFGRFVNSYRGIYNCAEDVNTSVEDMEVIHEVTEHVMGLKNKGGDPSPLTALGVFASIKATAEKKLGKPLSETHVAIQGLGHVGKYLFEMLTVTDKNPDILQEISQRTSVSIVNPENIHKQKCDIFAPCAMGGILNAQTIPELDCKAVVGAANNQLQDEIEDAKHLQSRHILYAPDYLVNAGGIINVYIEQSPEGYNKEKAEKATWHIAETLMEIFDLAEKENILPSVAANHVAEKRFLKA
jgi:leucine dehydrogenase